MKCNYCGKEPASIHLEGEGDFCIDCYNRLVAESYGWDENEFDHPREVTFTDKNGEFHRFHLQHMIFGKGVKWEATEENGYEISMNGSLEDSPQVQAGKFFRRITDVLWNSTLEENTSPLDKKPYISLRDHGNVNISWSSETNEVSFVIDGKPFSLQELGDLLEGYEGWTMQFQMRDQTEPIVKENEFLLPVELTNEALLSELTHAIWSFSEDDGDVPFISYKDTANLSEAVFGIIKKLEVMAHNYPPEMTIETGKAMIALLEAVETDDDFFPDYEIDMIGELIDLYK